MSRQTTSSPNASGVSYDVSDVKVRAVRAVKASMSIGAAAGKKGTNRVAASYSAAEAPASKEKRMRALWSGTSDEAMARLPVLLFLGRYRGRASWLPLLVRVCRSTGPSVVLLCSASSSLCAVAPDILVSEGAEGAAESGGNAPDAWPAVPEGGPDAGVGGAGDAPVSDFAP